MKQFPAPKNLLRTLAKTLAVLAVLATAVPAFADDVLENSPVTRRALQYRASRHELSAMFNMTLGDAYTHNWMPGLRYNYHILEWLAVGADVMLGISSPTDTFTQVQTKVKSLNDQFVMETSSLSYLASAHVQASPFVGKFVAFGVLPVQFDLHATLSIGVAGLTGGTAIDAKEGTYSLAPGVGGGFGVFFTKAIALNLELTEVFIKRTLAVTRFGQAPDPVFDGNMFFSAGLSFYLPPDLKRAD